MRAMKSNQSVQELSGHGSILNDSSFNYNKKLRIAPSAKATQNHWTVESNGNKQRKLKQAEQSYKFTRKQMK